MVDPALLRRSIRDLRLPTRTLNHLEYQGIKTLRGLVKYSKGDLLAWRGFAESSLKDVKRGLARFGLALRDAARTPSSRGRSALLFAYLAIGTAPANAQWTVVYLDPAKSTESFANGISGNQQVGGGEPTGDQNMAILWSGAAKSWVSLNPGNR